MISSLVVFDQLISILLIIIVFLVFVLIMLSSIYDVWQIKNTNKPKSKKRIKQIKYNKLKQMQIVDLYKQSEILAYAQIEKAKIVLNIRKSKSKSLDVTSLYIIAAVIVLIVQAYSIVVAAWLQEIQLLMIGWLAVTVWLFVSTWMSRLPNMDKIFLSLFSPLMYFVFLARLLLVILRFKI